MGITAAASRYRLVRSQMPQVRHYYEMGIDYEGTSDKRGSNERCSSSKGVSFTKTKLTQGEQEL